MRVGNKDECRLEEGTGRAGRKRQWRTGMRSREHASCLREGGHGVGG